MSVPREPLPAADSTELAHALAQLAGRGLPLAEGLKALAQDVPQRRLRRVLLDLAGGLEAGQSLDAAMSSLAGRVPPALLGLVRAGARSGRLGELLENYLLIESQGAELRRRMGLALSYPVFLAIACVAIFSFIEMAVVPRLAGFSAQVGEFGTAGGELPLSKLAIQISNAYPTFLAGAVAGSLALWLSWRYFLSAPLRDRLRQRIPLVGPVLRWTAWAHFCDVMALLLEHDTPLDESLRLAGAGVASQDIAESAGQIAADAAAGVSLRASPYALTRFPPSLYELIAGAEAQGTLPQAFRAGARMASGRARLQTGLVLLVAPWLGFAVIAVLVTLCAAAMFLPMMRIFELF